MAEQFGQREASTPALPLKFGERGVLMAKAGENLPIWTELAGGRPAWKKWVEGKVNSCLRRAKKWAEQRGSSTDELPTPAQWRAAILDAIEQCAGIGHYSKLELSLAPPRKCTDWNWPSIEHLEGPGGPAVSLETRLVNDMKTIMSEAEFLAMIGHLSASLSVSAGILPDGWGCRRSFAAEQTDEEPPLPK